MKLLDSSHPFFIPVWRRWATGILPIIWGGVEFYWNSPGWAILFVAAGVYALYELIFRASGNE